jgi:hypothetical protein
MPPLSNRVRSLRRLKCCKEVYMRGAQDITATLVRHCASFHLEE